MGIRPIAALLVAAAVASGLPAASSAAGASSGRLTVFAAASLTDVLPKIDALPRYGFAGSDILALQIQQGAPADVFAAASPKYPELLYKQGLVQKPIKFATNTLVLVLPKSNPAQIHTVDDLTKPGVKLVVGDPSVPVGAYTRTVLANLGISAAVLKNVVSNETDVRGVLAKVALGEADAGFVYITDAKTVRVVRDCRAAIWSGGRFVSSANSSPPIRAITSPGSACCVRTSPMRFSAALPAACPCT